MLTRRRLDSALPLAVMPSSAVAGCTSGTSSKSYESAVQETWRLGPLQGVPGDHACDDPLHRKAYKLRVQVLIRVQARAEKFTERNLPTAEGVSAGGRYALSAQIGQPTQITTVDAHEDGGGDCLIRGQRLRRLQCRDPTGTVRCLQFDVQAAVREHEVNFTAGNGHTQAGNIEVAEFDPLIGQRERQLLVSGLPGAASRSRSLRRQNTNRQCGGNRRSRKE